MELTITEKMELAIIEKAQKQFETAVMEAGNISLMQNAGAAFKAVVVVKNLRDVLTDEIMDMFFMPLMNAKIGFLTDRDGKRKDKNGKIPELYKRDIVRDCIIDAASFGLLPTHNQFNIISSKMYPTKEGYTYLLSRLEVKSVYSFGRDLTKDNDKYSEIQYTVNYEYKGDTKKLVGIAVVPKTAYSSYDQQKGKAERRAKKALFEYLTGIDLGEADTDSGFTPHEDVTHKAIEQKESSETRQIDI